MAVSAHSPLTVTVGAPRMIMRGPMFPWAMLFDDGSIIVISSSAEEGGPPAYVRSTDRGETWRPFVPPPGYCIPNVQLPDGTALNCASAPPPIADRPGYYQTARYESKDRGLSATFTNTAPGAPLPDLLQLVLAPERGQELRCLSLQSEAFDGTIDGTLSRATANQLVMRNAKGVLEFVVQSVEVEKLP